MPEVVMPVLHLLRHGTLLPNPERRFVGQRDIPLSEVGRRQARQVRQDLAAVPLTEAWTSDLPRCLEMSAIVLDGRNVPVHVEPAFREINLGSWEGLTKAEVDARFPGAVAARGKDLWNYTPEGGESFAMLALRVCSALYRRLAGMRGDAHALLVAHSGVNRVILMRYLALDMRDFFAVPQPYAACTTLFYGSDDLARLATFC